MCYCISTPRHYTHYTDEETEVQRGEGTFLNFYCTGLFDYYLHGGGQQVRHIQSLPWFWLIGLLQTVCTSPVLPSASGDVAALWLTRALPSGLPSACGLRRGPGLHPHAPPSCLSSKKCGSLITACVISPGMGCGPLLRQPTGNARSLRASRDLPRCTGGERGRACGSEPQRPLPLTHQTPQVPMSRVGCGCGD